MEEGGKTTILIIAGPTASGKSGRAVAEALSRNGEVISVDSRQVYRELNIGTEKVTEEEMRGVPHHLIDIREPEESYSAGEFVADAKQLIRDIDARGKLPILAGGTHFYFDALLSGLPEETPLNLELRKELELLTAEELYARVELADPRRAAELDPQNRRRLIRALEIVAQHGRVPERIPIKDEYDIEWIIIDPPIEELRERIAARLETALSRGLVTEVKRVREKVGDERLNEFGLEYRIVGEYLRGEREESVLVPALTSALNDYARRQKAWLRKLQVLQ